MEKLDLAVASILTLNILRYTLTQFINHLSRTLQYTAIMLLKNTNSRNNSTTSALLKIIFNEIKKKHDHQEKFGLYQAAQIKTQRATLAMCLLFLFGRNEV